MLSKRFFEASQINDIDRFLHNYTVSFFMVKKVFVHLTHLILSQISKTYFKIFVLLEHLIKLHLKYYKKYFLGI